ncbi:hypothetical protein BU26DRAFT_350334 [Trematosphaeria pertusa]|uniref:Uncharacterized protein n=1 Tax=Trematosphaeria pertusa TaxID=390896 RepID=A0A6A6IAI5_9PLEO|nr:uncharacterized protein BU26DRAFT_350334 [Trematosphaeria pertusa]KAF2247594.1 hypothetical protein BU26DRAFT_350334 [Trematosphaeria pertusa]
MKSYLHEQLYALLNSRNTATTTTTNIRPRPSNSESKLTHSTCTRGAVSTIGCIPPSKYPCESDRICGRPHEGMQLQQASTGHSPSAGSEAQAPLQQQSHDRVGTYSPNAGAQWPCSVNLRPHQPALIKAQSSVLGEKSLAPRTGNEEESVYRSSFDVPVSAHRKSRPKLAVVTSRVPPDASVRDQRRGRKPVAKFSLAGLRKCDCVEQSQWQGAILRRFRGHVRLHFRLYATLI